MLNKQCKDPSCTATKRHPKLCEYFSLTGLCKFKHNCAYSHEGNKFLKLENELMTIRNETKALSDMTLEMSKKLNELLCEYSAKTISAVISHK